MSTASNQAGALATSRDLSPGQIDALRPYVVNLNLGQFSTDGAMTTDQSDVDAIFDVHLPAFIARTAKPVPLVVWAHGGLVAEQTGLAIAQHQVSWWLRNGAFPLHFVWETGFIDALKQILSGRGARDLADLTIDPAIEFIARPLGSRMWTAMKTSADLASQTSGGATYVAQRLADFCRSHPGQVSLHAVGHSAGAIFHSHFLPAAKNAGAPAFDTLQLLAPALRVDGFSSRLLPMIGAGVDSLAMYTMNKQAERDDNCVQIYRKSLLYLVSRAFEPESEAPILGLEQSVRADPALVAAFGLRPGVPGQASVIFSPTTGNPSPDSRSSATSHGDFDNDTDTMNSVARRIFGRDDIVEFPAGNRSAARELGGPIATPLGGVSGGFASPQPQNGGVATGSGQDCPPVVPSGARRALCIGIDAYPAPNALGGCVADMQAWATLLANLGFSVTTLSDGAATREAILGNLRDLIATSKAGDVLAFQYSGHGTQVPDDDGDEEGGDEKGASNGKKDEAICPVDFGSGRLIVDDELRAELANLPEGVSFTSFSDCCHSGTNMRAFGTRSTRPAVAGQKARFVLATDELIAAHREFRRMEGNRRTIVTREQLRHISVAACRDEEVAFESNGHGHFTSHALRVLSNGPAGLTNHTFTEKVTALFGASPEQHPVLDCRAEFEGQPLLAGVTAAPTIPATSPATSGGRPAGNTAAPAAAESVADLLRAVAVVFDGAVSVG